MSSVSSTDGGYQAHARSISELRDEMDAEISKTKEKERAASEHLEENYRRTLAEEKERANQAIDAQKSVGQEAVARERENARVEVERLKRDTYNRLGKSHGLEGEVLQEQIKSMKEDWETQEANSRRSSESMERSYQDKLTSQAKDSLERAEFQADTIRKSVQETNEESRARNQALFEDYRAEQEKRYNALNQSRMDDLNTERSRMHSAVEDVSRDSERALRRTKNDGDSRTERSQHAASDDLEKQARELSRSRAEETDELRARIKDMTDLERVAEKRRAESLATDIAEREGDQRKQIEHLISHYERELSREKYKAEDHERILQSKSSETLRDRDAYNAELMRNQRNEHSKTERELTSEGLRALEQSEQMRAKDKTLASERMEQYAERSVEDKRAALVSQADSFNDSIRSQKSLSDDQIEALQKELRGKRETTDVFDVSPAAENALRKMYVKEYERQLEADVGRNRETVSSIQGEYANRLSNTVQQKDSEKTAALRDQSAQSAWERSEMHMALADTEETKKIALRDLSFQHEKESDQSMRAYAGALERQRRSYEEMLDHTRTEGASKLQQTRQELEFNHRISMREQANRQQEVARKYERQVNEVRQTLGDQIEELKGQLYRERADANKQNKQMLEDQAKGYEQRLSQLELSGAEREKYIRGLYEDQMDKMRRTNALLSQKRSS